MNTMKPAHWLLLIHQLPPKPDYFRVKIWRRLQAQAQDVAERLRGEHLMATEVAIKLRYGVTWVTITRQQRLGAPTDDAQVLAAGAAALMRKAWTRRPIRLIGLRAAGSPAKRLTPVGTAAV